VSPSGELTTVQFSLDPDTGSIVQPDDLAAAAPLSDVTAAVSGLTCETAYQFRVSATNASGTSDGDLVAFTTADCVTPPTIGTPQAQSITDAVGTALAGPGACNEGFLRDDAILVVTLISDEDDKVSEGTIEEWKQQIVDAKQGNEDAVVMLGLLGDVEAPDPVCQFFDQDAPLGGAEDAPKLRSFFESFSKGSWASVCELDYSSFFLEAVEQIDVACDENIPPG